MTSVLMVMKKINGCCPTIDTPLQRFFEQQHVVTVPPGMGASLQVFAFPAHKI